MHEILTYFLYSQFYLNPAGPRTPQYGNYPKSNSDLDSTLKYRSWALRFSSAFSRMVAYVPYVSTTTLCVHPFWGLSWFVSGWYRNQTNFNDLAHAFHLRFLVCRRSQLALVWSAETCPSINFFSWFPSTICGDVTDAGPSASACWPTFKSFPQPVQNFPSFLFPQAPQNLFLLSAILDGKGKTVLHLW